MILKPTDHPKTHHDKNIGVLLVNLGTPENTETKSIRIYLKEFLSDPDMLDYPSSRPDHLAKGFDKVKNYVSVILRWTVLKLIVLPFRPSKIKDKYAGIVILLC